MPRMNLLEMAQDIMSDMSSDNINSINDTTEALQVAQILKSTYYEIIHSREWPHLRKLVEITGLGDTTKPTHMQLATDVVDIDWIKYDSRSTVSGDPNYIDVGYLSPSNFLLQVMQRTASNTNITAVTDVDTTTLLIRNDENPKYWTSFDDEYIVFDAYKSTVDSTLQGSKTQVYGLVEPSFTISDTFIPDLPNHAFPYYLAEAKSTCFNSIGQTPNAKEEQKSRRQRTWLARKAGKIEPGIQYPNYGR